VDAPDRKIEVGPAEADELATSQAGLAGAPQQRLDPQGRGATLDQLLQLIRAEHALDLAPALVLGREAQPDGATRRR